MRYGNPSIESAVQALRDWGADRLLLFPLYPQYAGATTGSTYDEVFRQLSMLRFVPALRVVPPYFAHAAYLEALAESVREATTALPRPPEKILVSFHGIPQRFVESGDPYASHCEATALSLAARAGWESGSYQICLSIPCRPANLGCVRTRTRPSSNWRGTVRAT